MRLKRRVLHQKVTCSTRLLVRLLRLTRSMPEVARCNTIEIDEAAVRAGSKISLHDQVERALVARDHAPR
jgi:hypothetical protein